MTNLQQIFDEISELISDRGEEHGNFVDNMQGIADLWSNFLDTPINSTQVCTMLCLVKISRITCGKFNLDDFCNKPVGLHDWVINAEEKLLHYPECFRQNINSITNLGGKNGSRNRSVHSREKSHHK